MTADHPVGADHHTRPAANAFIGICKDYTIFHTADGAADAGMHAGGVFAMTAQDRNFFIRYYPLYEDAAFRYRAF